MFISTVYIYINKYKKQEKCLIIIQIHITQKEQFINMRIIDCKKDEKDVRFTYLKINKTTKTR